jgi:hypothetical protein
MIRRERAVPLNGALRSGMIASPRAETGMSVLLILHWPRRQNVPSGRRVTGRRVRDNVGYLYLLEPALATSVTGLAASRAVAYGSQQGDPDDPPRLASEQLAK